jgi:hypothetical protein
MTSSTIRRLGSLPALLAVAGLGACASDGFDAPPASIDDALVSTIDLGPGHTIRVYEPSPGDLVFEETAAPGVAAIDLDVGTIEPIDALYRRLRPGQAVPRELERLAAHQVERASHAVDPGEPAALEEEEEPGLSMAPAGARAAASAAFEFRLDYCHDLGEENDSGVKVVDWTHCWTERTGNSFAWATGLHAAQAVVRSYRGSITFTVSFDDGNGWTIESQRTVAENQTKHWWRWDTGASFGFKSEVTNADGNLYHHSIFGTHAGSRAVADCYDHGYHCGIGSSTQP